jgi:hypothetical protein
VPFLFGGGGWGGSDRLLEASGCGTHLWTEHRVLPQLSPAPSPPSGTSTCTSLHTGKGQELETKKYVCLGLCKVLKNKRRHLPYRHQVVYF